MSSFLFPNPAASFRFVGVKAKTPVHVRSSSALQPLIVAALDPDVLDIAAAPADLDGAIATVTRVGGERVALFEAGDDAYVLPTHEAYPSFAYDRSGPSFANAFLVWGCRRRHVDHDVQLRVLAFLQEHGTATLERVAEAVNDVDAVPMVLAMACRDKVAIRLSERPLSLDMVVGQRGR